MSHYLPLVAALITMLVTTLLVYGKNISQTTQHDAQRDLEPPSTPRSGGIALLAGILAAWVLVFKELSWWVVLPLLAVFVVSLMDDRRGVPLRTRLLVQSGASLLLLFGSGVMMQYPLLAAVLLFIVVWMTNLYNFMDGADGLASGMAFFGFTAYGVAALIGSQPTFAMLNFSVAAAALGFLYYNYSPAKIFLGDSGSMVLGFLVSAMGVAGWQLGLWSLWFPLLVFFPFIADSSVTQVIRKLHGKKITVPHREHFYQRLLDMGWSHKQLAVAAYVLMIGVAITGMIALHQSSSWVVTTFLAWIAIYAGLMFLIHRRWQTFQGEMP